MVIVPERMRRNNREARGPEGAAWLSRLPAILADVRERWSLAIGDPYPRLSFNYVVPAVREDGTPAVLKLCFPDREFRSEVNALRLYAGRGSARLLEADPNLGALLVERIEPGTPLHALRDEPEEIRIAAGVMRRLWRPEPAIGQFPTVADWGRAFDRHRAEHGGAGPLPRAIFEHGESLYRDLDASTGERVLLHGDLHHDNILAAQREPWLAIDPKGLVGDPAFEVGPLLLNLWQDLYPVPDPGTLLRGRVDRLSEALGLDRERVRAWGIAFCVLSAVWSAENGGTGWEGAIANAELLA